MKYLLQFSWRDGLTQQQRDEVLMKRAQWKYPDGISVHGEYWCAGNNPAVLVVCECAEFKPLMEIGFAWSYAFDISTTPCVTADEGLLIGPEAMQAQRA